MRKVLIERLENLEEQRQQVEELEQALSQLTPVEQLVIRRRVMEKESLDGLCQLLEVEPRTIYRWRNDALRKLERILKLG